MSAGDSSVRSVFSRPIHSGRLLMMSENCKILEALTHMANLGIVHRDLKPSNLLIGESRRSAELFVFILAETMSSSHLKKSDRENCIKIGDFGLAATDFAQNEASMEHAPLRAASDAADLTSGELT